MSRIRSYTPLPNRLLTVPLGHPAYRLYCALLSHADEAGVCWPGEELLAWEMGVKALSSVRRALRELEQAGLVSTRWRTIGEGQRIGITFQCHLYWGSAQLTTCLDEGCGCTIRQQETISDGPSRIARTDRAKVLAPTEQNRSNRPSESARQKRDPIEQDPRNQTHKNEVSTRVETAPRDGHPDLIVDLRLHRIDEPAGSGSSVLSSWDLPQYRYRQRVPA